MTTDCFGNPTPGIPPSIADNFHDIERFRPIPVTRRLGYNNARNDAMVGHGDPAKAWDMYWDMVREITS